MWAKAGLGTVWSSWGKLQEETYSCLALVQSHSLLRPAGQDPVSPGSWRDRNSWDPTLPGRHSPLPRGSEGARCPLVSEAAHPDSTGGCRDLCTLQLTFWQPREVASCNPAGAPWQCRENTLETGSRGVYGEGLTNRQSAVFS